MSDVSKRQVNAVELARTLSVEDISEAALQFPCGFCGAKATKPCRSTRNAEREAKTHSSRGAVLWAMWHKGYRAGRERTEHELAS